MLAIIWLVLAPACDNGPPNPATSAPPEPANASTTTATPMTTAPTNQLTLPATPPVHGLPAPLSTQMLTPLPDTPSLLSTQTPTPLPKTPTPVATQARNPVILEIAEGTRARYLVKEQFVRFDFPNDAVGETSEVRGSISFRPDGTIDPAGSSFQVQLRRLSSDDAERDEFLSEESLESLKFPVAEFVLEQAPGLPWPLPQDGQVDFQLQGEMTVHGVASPATWEVTAQFTPQGASGRARTSFDFAKFGIHKAFVILSFKCGRSHSVGARFRPWLQIR